MLVNGAAGYIGDCHRESMYLMITIQLTAWAPQIKRCNSYISWLVNLPTLTEAEAGSFQENQLQLSDSMLLLLCRSGPLCWLESTDFNFQKSRTLLQEKPTDHPFWKLGGNGPNYEKVEVEGEWCICASVK